MKTLIFVLVFFILSNFLSATIINVPADQPTIQAGINVAVHSDTVLVQPDTYIENINFNGKNITIASLFLTTQDTTYISQTVIDGNQNGSVVIFENGEDSTAVLCGFTITNGLGGILYPGYSGGISIVNSAHPELNYLIIQNNLSSWIGGGGIHCFSAGCKLSNSIIRNNSSTIYGGGIVFNNSESEILNTQINNNNSKWGGGACFLHSSIQMTSSTIKGNHSINGGGGLFISINDSIYLSSITILDNVSDNLGGGVFIGNPENIIFDPTNRCSIYNNSINYNRGVGSDIFIGEPLPMIVVLDTFTVFQPSDYYASPIDFIEFDIIHSTQEDLINADLYISTNGDDSNIGTSPEFPLKKIQTALERIYTDSLNHNTIHLLPGVYSPSTTGELFPVHSMSHLTISGTSAEEVFLDAEQTNTVLEINNLNNSIIKNVTIRNGLTSYYGGGIRCHMADFKIENCLLINNFSEEYGGAIFCNETILQINKCTISNNDADHGGAICCDSNNEIEISNSIFFFNEQEICLLASITQGEFNIFTVLYSDISGGEEAIENNNNQLNTIYWENNIDENPQFIDYVNDDYHLSEFSPCIDAGDPNSPLDPDGTITDMGVFFFDQTSIEQDIISECSFELLDNYPNPFNPSTTISFSIPNESIIKLGIYNIKGQLVRVIVNKVLSSGEHSVVWNGRDSNSKSVSSGIYFYKINVNDKTEAVKKCLLLK